MDMDYRQLQRTGHGLVSSDDMTQGSVVKSESFIAYLWLEVKQMHMKKDSVAIFNVQGTAFCLLSI